MIRRSIRNKVLLITGALLAVAVVMTGCALYLANTLSMVTAVSRGERTFTFNVLQAQAAAARYIHEPNEENRESFLHHIHMAHEYALTFGMLSELIRKKPASEVVEMVDSRYPEFNRTLSEVVVNRVTWLGWLPEVESLLLIAREAAVAVREYEVFTTAMFERIAGDVPDRNRVLEEWEERNREILDYPNRFSLGTEALSSFVLSLATGSLVGLLLFLLFLGGFVSMIIARSIIRPIQQETDHLLESASSISGTAAQSSETAAVQSASIEQVTTTVEEIDRMSAVSSESAQSVLSSSVESARRGTDGLTMVEKAVAIMSTISEVSVVVDIVDHIAEQSNLLAVNAGIEAAKAGDAGKGFAVVAAEVRSLSIQSKNATSQIRDAIGRTAEGRQAIEQVHETMAKLAESLDESAEKARQISKAAMQQSAGIGQIKDAMRQLASNSKVTTGAAKNLEKAVENISAIAHSLKAVVTG